MEKLIREYQDGDQLMQEFEITTESGKIHIVKKPILQEPTKEELLEKLKQNYLIFIRDAQTLGDTDEVTRLQNEYQVKKAELEVT